MHLLADVHVTLHAAEGRVVESAGFFTVKIDWNNTRNGNVRRFWKLVGLLLNFRIRFALCVVIQTNVAQFLRDIWNNLPLCGGSERALSPSEGLHQIFGVTQSKTFVNGHWVREAVTRVHPAS